ncbi:MAG: sigma-54-dependent transcriptional regulator [bacterium]
MAKILVVDDSETIRKGIGLSLEMVGHEVTTASDGAQALEILRKNRYDLVITDLKMPEIDGMELLRRIKEEGIDASAIVITAYGTIEGAVEAMKLGAEDFITKPLSMDELELKVRRTLEDRNLRNENERLREENLSLRREAGMATMEGMVGRSPEMKELYELIEKVAQSKSSVLIRGESGTGKELVARAIHARSPRRDMPFVTVNCVALPENLLESELFGHERGAFTGAIKRKLGKFEIADGGTVFLDEVGDTPPSIQAKLLRVLQDRSFERVGGNETISVDVRVIAATNKNLERAVERGEFRDDLYFRLNVIPIIVPPLRERREDIPLLVRHFLDKYAKEIKKLPLSIEEDALEALTKYDWPGNVRELENCIERLVVLGTPPSISLKDLPPDLRRKEDRKFAPGERSLDLIVEDVERRLIEEAMERARNVVSEAAKILGINRTTLQYKLKKYGWKGGER